MFGDDSRLRLRRHNVPGNDGGGGGGGGGGGACGMILPHYDISSSSTNNNNANNNNNSNATTASMRKKRKRKRRQDDAQYCMSRIIKMCCSGLCAALVSSFLSISLLPFSWTQVDYHHQVQKAATHLYQVLEQNRRNHITAAIRGKHHGTSHNAKEILCSDGVTVGFENDDYCDCLDDGSDEPLTSACSYRTIQQPTFICKSSLSSNNNNGGGGGGTTNTDSIIEPPIRIYASRVGDGVKDCPDGSDEL